MKAEYAADDVMYLVVCTQRGCRATVVPEYNPVHRRRPLLMGYGMTVCAAYQD